MTPELPAFPTFINTNTAALLEHMLDALAGELSGAGGGSVAQAREHARTALRLPEGQRAASLGEIRTALTQAARERPQATYSARSVDVIAATRTPAGLTVTLSDAARVMVSPAPYLFLMLPPGNGGRAWVIAHAGTPQAMTYVLPAPLILEAAAALGFDVGAVAQALEPSA